MMTRILERENEGGINAIDTSPDLIRHLFAKEFGWTHEETNRMTMSAISKELILLEEDKEREKRKQ